MATKVACVAAILPISCPLVEMDRDRKALRGTTGAERVAEWQSQHAEFINAAWSFREIHGAGPS